MSVHPEDFMSAHAGIQNEIEYSKVSMHKNFDALIQEIQKLTTDMRSEARARARASRTASVQANEHLYNISKSLEQIANVLRNRT